MGGPCGQGPIVASLHFFWWSSALGVSSWRALLNRSQAQQLLSLLPLPSARMFSFDDRHNSCCLFCLCLRQGCSVLTTGVCCGSTSCKGLLTFLSELCSLPIWV